MSIRRSGSASLAFVAATLVLLSLGQPALAGGSWFSPVKDRYEPGETATLLGYTGGGDYGWIEDGPFFGYLTETNDDLGPLGEGLRLPLGEIVLEETGDSGYTKLRAAITFALPDDISAGVYWFDYCNLDCSEQLGDLIGGVLFVGVDPEYPVWREWPLDEPELANLDADAIIAGPGFEITAAEATSITEPEVPPSTSAETSTTTTTQPAPAPPETTVLEVEVIAASERTPGSADDLSFPLAAAGAAAIGVSGLSAWAVRRRRSEASQP